jgi:CDP-glycerol glycerophosphotransferase
MSAAVHRADPPVPRLSLVVVVHREQAYVEQFAASLREQDAGPLEVVAVDDAGHQHAPALLDELAADDPRVRVVRLAQRAGLAGARAAGLRAARGRHVWFVHPTDTFAPDGLGRVLARLDATSADVLIVDHERVDRLGRSHPAPHRKLIATLAAEDFAGPLAERPQLLGAGKVVWDKVMRRELVAPSGAPGPGLVWPVLLAAERIAALADPVYRRHVTAVGVREDGPFQLAAGYEAALRAVDRDDPGYRMLAEAAIRAQFALVRRVPQERRGELFAIVVRTARAHGGIGRGALADLGSYSAERARQRAGAAKASARRRMRQRAAQPAPVAPGPRRPYREGLREPLDPNLAVFAAYWDRGYQCNPRAIYEKARELVPEVRGVWTVNRKWADEMPAGVEYVVNGTPEHRDVLARASVLVNNVNWPHFVVKRPGSIHVMTHHGTPLKRMGLDLRYAAVGSQKLDFPGMLRRSAYWDYSISSNRLSTLVWERVYPVRFETLEVGYPRNDVLVNATDDEIERIRASLGIAPDQVAVLYAPTHREWNDGYVPVLDVERLAQRLPDDHVVLARTHYFYRREPRDLARADRMIDVGGHPSIAELSLAADVLVTDYSSLMFDYGVLDRPIVIHAPDWETYRRLRGTYFDLMAEAPGAVTTTEDELVAALRDGAARSPEAEGARAAFRARFCALDDGRAAERVVERVWLTERSGAAPRAAVAR